MGKVACEVLSAPAFGSQAWAVPAASKALEILSNIRRDLAVIIAGSVAWLMNCNHSAGAGER